MSNKRQAKQVEVHLTLVEIRILRRLIIQEARREGYPDTVTDKLKRMKSVADKIYYAWAILYYEGR